MTVINRSKAIKDTVLLVRDVLASGITDPISATRSSTSKFVVTSWPERITQYPIITVEQQGWSAGYLGMGTTDTLSKVGLELNVWTQKVEQRDSLAGSVLAVIETTRTALVASGLHDLRWTNVSSINAEGKAGIHRTLIEGTFIYPSG